MFLSKEFNRLAFLKKIEHPKHNVFCPCLSDKAFLKNQGPQALGIFISLSVSLLFFSKNSLLGLFFLINSVWQILFYLLAHCVYISSFEKRIRRREEQTRSRDKTHNRRPARLKRNAKCSSLSRTSSLPAFGFCVEGEKKRRVEERNLPLKDISF